MVATAVLLVRPGKASGNQDAKERLHLINTWAGLTV